MILHLPSLERRVEAPAWKEKEERVVKKKKKNNNRSTNETKEKKKDLLNLPKTYAIFTLLF